MDLQFRGPCHCNVRPRLPVHFLLLVCLLSLPWNPTRDDDRLPPSVQQHGGENASALKVALVARRSSTSWPSELPWVLLGLRSMPQEQSGISSAELVFCTTPTLLGQFLSTPSYLLNPGHTSSLAVVSWRPKHRFFSALKIA